MTNLYRLFLRYLLAQMAVLASVPFVHEQILFKNYVWSILLILLMFICFYLVVKIMKVTQIVIETNAKKASRKYCSKLIEERNVSLSLEKQELLYLYNEIQNGKVISIQNIDVFRHYCSYPLIDAILKQKAGLMKQKKIDYNISAVVFKTIAADQTAILAILMNLLDNAMDAALETKKPIVDVRIWTKGGYLIFKIENTAVSPPTFGFSTKVLEGHGLGLRIVEQTCLKNSGTVQTQFDNNRCIITATMLMEETR